MTYFTCKVCGQRTDGNDSENRWRCPKCNNKILIEKLLEYHSKGKREDIDFTRENTKLLKLIKKCEGLEAEGGFTSSSEDSKVPSEESDLESIPSSSPDIKQKSFTKRKRFRVNENDIPPTKKTKPQKSGKNNQVTQTRENVEQRTYPTTLKKGDCNLILSEVYKGSPSFYPKLPFNEGLDEFKG